MKKNDIGTTQNVRRAGLLGLAAILAAGGCSSAERTSARGWEFGGEPATHSATDVWASPTVKPAAAHPGSDAGSLHASSGAAPVRFGANQPASVSGEFNQHGFTRGQNHGQNHGHQGHDAVGTPFGQVALTTGGGFEPRQAQFGADVFGELPATDQAAANTSASMMLDGMESLSQITFTGDGSSFDPCISRDGSFVVFASTQHRPTADIYLKPVHGRTLTQLTADPAHDIMPAVSPDGRRVAFASNRSGSWDIYLMSSDGGQAVQLTSDSSRELHPSWSPDGNKLVFCRLGEVSNRWEMWVMNLGEPKAAEFIGYGLFPRWSPVAGTGEGGRDKIAFQRSRERGDRAFSIWTVDYRAGDVSSPTEIASSTRDALINPNWSADGEWITYAAVPSTNLGTNASGRPASADLWIAHVGGFGRVNLTSGNFVNLAPTWGPDNRIYFVSDRGGVENIWSIGTEKAIAAATGQLPGNSPVTPSEHATGHGERLPVDSRGTAHVPTP